MANWWRDARYGFRLLARNKALLQSLSVRWR
jgi:hypothetical protein